MATAPGVWSCCSAGIEQIAVVIEPATTIEIVPITAQEYGLSGQEQRIMGLAARGVGTAYIASGLSCRLAPFGTM